MLSPGDAELIRRDAGVKGLRLLLDDAAFGQALRYQFPHAQIDRVCRDYVRYKPYTNCLVRYRVHARGKSWSIYAKAFASGAEKKIAKWLAQAAATGPFGPGRIALPAANTVVSFLPNDAKLRHLNVLADATARASLWRELRPGAAEPCWDERRTLQYKPERRYVAVLPESTGRRTVVKFYTEDRFLYAERNARLVAAARIRSPRCVGVSRRFGVLGYEWEGGRRLSDLYTRPDFDPALAEAVGAALARLHRSDLAALPARRNADEFASLARVAEGVCLVLPAFARRVQRIVARLADPGPASWSRAALIHGDFYAAQTLCRADAVIMLDFDELGVGDAAIDLATFRAHLERAVLDGAVSIKRARSVNQSLLRGYAAVTRPPPGAHLELRAAQALFKLALQPFRDGRAEWPNGVAAVLDRCEALVAGRTGVRAYSGND